MALQLEDDASHMRRAIALAQRGWGRVAPNPLVGAVIVEGGEVVGEGWHRQYGEAHAEVEAIRSAGARSRGATLFVTLEPCSHHGKTPPCTQAILEAGIVRVVFASGDPNPRAEGGGTILREKGVEVLAGVEEPAARALNGPFFWAHQPEGRRRPWTELKLAVSLDGRIADAGGRSNWITGEEARAEVHHLRAGADAIAVGIGTALADDPSLTVRGETRPRVAPKRIVFDRSLRIPLQSRLVRSAREIPVWVVCAPGAPEAVRRALEGAGVVVLEAIDLSAGLETIARAGIRSLLCEGGAQLASAFLRNHAVDRLTLFYAPLLLGPGGADPFGQLSNPALADAVRWKLVRTASFGSDTLISVER